MSSRFSLHDTAISGHGVTLLPSEASHAERLCTAAVDESTFRYFSRGPEPFDTAGFEAYIDSFRGDESVRMYTVQECETGRLAGMTSFLSIDPSQRRLEIGWTWYGPKWRASRVNPACKLLLLELAFEGGLFEGLGAVRVQLRTDALNAQSRGAIQKLGATYEGTLRNHVITPGGEICARSMYSILPEEWDTVRAGLERRLDRATDLI